MILFTLSMPRRSSWNGAWSGENRVYARARYDRDVPKELWDKDFHYSWDDGWEACVEVKRASAKEAEKIMKKSVGFCGYDWMIDSLIRDGYIHPKGKV